MFATVGRAAGGEGSAPGSFRGLWYVWNIPSGSAGLSPAFSRKAPFFCSLLPNLLAPNQGPK